MKGTQHVHGEGQIGTIYFDVMGRSSRGNERDIKLLSTAIEELINNFANGRFMHSGVEGSIDHETRDCC